MEEKERAEIKVIVCPHADGALEEVADYIALDSLLHAERVRFEILTLIHSLNKQPLRFPECLELPTKNHIYRKAVYVGTYKIIYKIVENEIWILDIFHGKRNPAELKKLRKVKP